MKISNYRDTEIGVTMYILKGTPVESPGYHPPTGFKPRHCEHCGGKIWLGPKQLELMNHDDVKVICHYCVQENTTEGVLSAGHIKTDDIRSLMEEDDLTRAKRVRCVKCGHYRIITRRWMGYC